MKLSKKSIKKYLYKKRGQSRSWLAISLLSSLFVLFFLFSFGAIPLLYVNGDPIYGPEVTRLIDNYGIRGAFEKAVEYKLIKFEAERRNLQITAEDKYLEYQKLKAQAEIQGLTVAQMLLESDQTYGEFGQNVETTITVYRLLGENLYITESEVDEYFKDNRLLFEDVDNEKLREDVKLILFRKKVSQRYTDFIKEAKARSDIDYFLLTE
jgi:hypothetical protein